MMNLKSLRSRMTATFALAFALLILIFGGFVVWFSRHTAQTNADAALQIASGKIQSEFAEAQQTSENSAWSDEPNELAQQNLALIIVDKQERVTPKTPGKVPAWPLTDENAWRIRTIPWGNNTAVLGFYWQKTENALRQQALMLTTLSAALCLAATFGAWILVGRTLLPIYGLSIQADTASTDNLQIHLHAPSQDAEIVHLVGTLNALLGRLSGAISARERFYAAASHELRTPLQTMTGYLELALMRERSAEDYRAALEEASTQSQRLTSLVQALLLLNQLKAAPTHEKQSVNLGEVCVQWTEEFASLAQSRGLRFTFCPSEMGCIQATSSHLDILLRNLLENAVKYAVRDSEVQMCVTVTPKEIWLTIFNKCLLLSEWSEAKLFEPFYRPDASRNSETGGNGLGLAICKAVAEANDWLLSLQQEGNGVRAKVIFKQN